MESNQQACRICLDKIDSGILVFGEEGKRQYLQDKIKKYLYITVSSEDMLPKIICDGCCEKLDSIHKFATMANQNQDKFLNKEIECEEQNGLLRTYLTQGLKEEEYSEQGDSRRSNTIGEYLINILAEDRVILSTYSSFVKEMKSEEERDLDFDESVDPRMIVQCSLQENDEDDDSEYPLSSEEDRSESDNSQNDLTLHKCFTCSKNFPSDFLLMIHSWDHKYEEGPSDENIKANEDCSPAYACPVCGKEVSTKGNLKVHVETHRPKGKYACDKCGRIFKTQCNLHRHKEYHGTPQFPCIVCGRVYPTNSTLRAHSITHSDVRPHKCPLCTKTFKRNQDLKFHINQHTGARPYQCPYCPKAFASSGNCFSHRKRMHPIEVERDRERAAKIMR